MVNKSFNVVLNAPSQLQKRNKEHEKSLLQNTQCGKIVAPKSFLGIPPLSLRSGNGVVTVGVYGVECMV